MRFMKSLLRRIEKLEHDTVMAAVTAEGPFTEAEMKNLVERVINHEPISAEEMARLKRWGVAYSGEYAVRAHGEALFIKRYVGVDLALI